jgi:hypothetical protein
MDIIIQILIALRLLATPAQFTDEYRRNHQTEIQTATTIYTTQSYEVNEGGIIVDDGIDPQNKQ